MDKKGDRAPRHVRRQVERALRKATNTPVTIARTADGMFDVGVRPKPGAGAIVDEFYIWEAQLPGGRSVARLSLRPIHIDREPWFEEVVESLASAIHRGSEAGAIDVLGRGDSFKAIALDRENEWASATYEDMLCASAVELVRRAQRRQDGGEDE